jgi:hypothetical protein
MRHRDVERRPDGRLPVADGVRTYSGQCQVKGEQRQGHANRAMASAIRAQESDFRNWAQIRDWATGIADALLS